MPNKPRLGVLVYSSLPCLLRHPPNFLPFGVWADALNSTFLLQGRLPPARAPWKGQGLCAFACFSVWWFRAFVGYFPPLPDRPNFQQFPGHLHNRPGQWPPRALSKRSTRPGRFRVTNKGITVKEKGPLGGAPAPLTLSKLFRLA